MDVSSCRDCICHVWMEWPNLAYGQEWEEDDKTGVAGGLSEDKIVVTDFVKDEEDEDEAKELWESLE